MTAKKSPQSPDQVGARRAHGGGSPQKWMLDERGRRMIIERYDGSSKCIASLQRSLKVPRYVIRQWARELKLTKTKDAGYSHWAPDEIAYLEQHINSKSIEDIAKHLGRSKGAVQIKISTLGIGVSDGYSLSDISDGFGCSRTTVDKWVKDGKLKGTRRVFDPTTWNFTEAQIRDFIRSHPEEIDLRRVDKLWFLDVCLELGALDNAKNR